MARKRGTRSDDIPSCPLPAQKTNFHRPEHWVNHRDGRQHQVIADIPPVSANPLGRRSHVLSPELVRRVGMGEPPATYPGLIHADEGEADAQQQGRRGRHADGQALGVLPRPQIIAP